jgi:hypothetical protein
MRTWYYLLHYITYEVFEPSFVEVSPLTGQDRTLVNVHGTLTFRPKRSLLVPPSLLLPEAIPVSGQWRVGIKGPLTTGKVGGRLVVAGSRSTPSPCCSYHTASCCKSRVSTPGQLATIPPLKATLPQLQCSYVSTACHCCIAGPQPPATALCHI